jgi:hypothetical protein
MSASSRSHLFGMAQALALGASGSLQEIADMLKSRTSALPRQSEYATSSMTFARGVIRRLMEIRIY